MAYFAVDIPSPLLVTPAMTAASILPGSQHRWVHSVEIYVRDIGSATYVRVGNSHTQNRTLSATGEFFGYDAPLGGVLDASQIFVISDAIDATLEITLLDSRVRDEEVVQ